MSMGPMNEIFYRQREEPSWIVDRVGSYRDRPESSPFSRNGRYLQYIELKVPMCCAKCEEKVREALLDMEGVYNVLCDQHSQRVTVTASNYVDPLRLLKKVKRIKKKSEFWAENTLLNKTQYYATGLNSDTMSNSYNRKRNQYTLPSATRTFFDPYQHTTTQFDPYHAASQSSSYYGYNLPPYTRTYYPDESYPYPMSYYYY